MDWQVCVFTFEDYINTSLFLGCCKKEKKIQFLMHPLFICFKSCFFKQNLKMKFLKMVNLRRNKLFLK